MTTTLFPSNATSAREPLSIGSRVSALTALFWLTLRQHLHGRKLWVLSFLFLLPCGLAILLRSLNRSAPPEELEFALALNLMPHALAPLAALLYSAGLIRDEVEDQTLTYLLLRPLPRAALYLTRWLASVVLCMLLVGLFTLILYATIHVGGSVTWNQNWVSRAFKAASLFCLMQVAYCSLFGFIGLLTKRTLIAGVSYIVLLEGIVSNYNFVSRELTAIFYYRILVLRWFELPVESVTRWSRSWQLKLDEVATSPGCVQILLIASGVLLILSAVVFPRQEYRMKTPEGAD